jgi:N12 class adenine-specific DNA methylase
MARKYELITELYHQTLKEITSSQGAWRAFLRSACCNYKCRFDEQVLIYAQRPDARAVLELEDWNKKLGRWVNRGAMGIAVFDDTHTGNSRLKHYFDISDTHAGRFSRSVPIWEMQERYEEEVIEALEGSFGAVQDNGSLESTLLQIVHNVVEDNEQDYFRELMYCRENSYLEDLDEFNVEVFFRQTLEASVSYMLLERCFGGAADQYAELVDFSSPFNFNTRETVNALGIATSDMAEMVLKEIALTVRNIQKRERQQNRTVDKPQEAGYPVNEQETNEPERSFEYESDIPQRGRLQSAQPSSPAGDGSTPWEIRVDAQEVSQGEPPRDLREPSDIGQAEQPPDGDRADGAYEAGTDGAADGEGRGRDRGTESHRSDEMGGPDEQHPALGGGGDTERTDLQLDIESPEEADSDELPAFLDDTLIMGVIANKDDDLKYKKQQIALFFSIHPDESERAEYIQSAYPDRYSEILVDGRRVGFKPQEDGLLMWEGAYLSRSSEAVFSWQTVVAWTAQLIEKKEHHINRDIKALKTQASQQMSLFDLSPVDSDTPYEQVSLAGAFAIPQSVIDEALCLGGNEPYCLERICAWFSKDYPLEQNAAFLFEEYGTSGKGFFSGVSPYALWFDGAGIRIGMGRTTQSATTLITWEDAAKRIRELLDTGRYVPQSVLDNAPENERKELTEHLWHTVQDFSREAHDENLIPTILAIYNTHEGFPANAAQIRELLKDSETVSTLITEVEAFAARYAENPDLMRFRFRRHDEILTGLHGLLRPHIEFSASPDFSLEPKQFITNDEIDRLLTGGSNIQHSKFRIYSYFLQGHTPKEQADFLKHEYGTGGGGRLGFNENHDSKGITYKRENAEFVPYDTILLKWPQVEKRVSELIRQGKYMSEKDMAYIPTYEKHELAREIQGFFSGLPQEIPRPFPYGFDFYEAVKLIEPQLDDPVRMKEIYQMMLPVWESTARDNRHYDFQKRAFEHMTAYRNGTFSLFGGKKEPAAISGRAEEVPTPTPAQDVKLPAEQERQDYEALAGRLNDFYKEFGPYDYADALEPGETEGDVIARLEMQIQQPEQLARILDDLALSRDVLDPDEEIAIDLELLIEDLQALSDGEPEPPVQESPESLVGQAVMLDGREFVVDRVDESIHTAFLRGTIPQDGVETPVVRHETTFFVRELMDKALAQAEMKEKIAAHLDKAGYVVSDELIDAGMKAYYEYGYNGYSDDIAAYIRAEYLAENEPIWEKVEGGEVARVRIDLMPEPQKVPAEKENVLAPPKPKRERVLFSTLHPEIPAEQRYNFRITDPQLGVGTPSEKFAANAAAIRTLKRIEDDDRLATPEEQETLSRYVGWGGLADCFDERHGKYLELKSLLDEDEYAAARASSLTAFYTPPVIVEAMYKALSQMGFERGNILEPACGVGNFIGMIPDSMAESKAYGVEIDSISGRIARQLYQNSSIAVDGFEKVEMPDSFFDVAIGNVPFGDFKVLDRRYDKHKWLIHDYFFGKALDKVRPGGVVAFITSKGTMDKENSAVRKYLAQRADLIGAIRLPDNAFKRNAGTDVTSDIIFLQKRDRMTDIEPDWVHLDTDENGIRINRYFAAHPDMILGEMVMESTAFGMDSACKPYEGANLSEQLSEAVSNLHAEITDYEVDELEGDEDLSVAADPSVRNFSYTIVDGKIYFRENSRMYPVELSVTAENRIRGMIVLRDCTRQLIAYQTEDYPEDMIRQEQARLGRLYDDYTRKYGLLCSRGNSLAFGEDSSYCLLCSLEVLDEEGNFLRKADMFTKRTIRPHVPVTSVDTASEALAVSISEKARVDMEYMAQLSGKSEAELEAELTGVIFRDVNCATDPDLIPKAFVDLEKFPFVTADEYLSGNVRKKLQMLRALETVLPAEEKNRLQTSITAMEAVQPEDLTAAEIGVRIGATWIPPEIYKQFMFELFSTGGSARHRMNVLYSKYTGEWNITDKNSDLGNIKAVTTYGTKRINAYYILEQTLNLKDVRIFDTIIENGNEKRVLNKKETAIAQDRQELIKSRFSEWLWKDIDRREMLCRIYNDTFNSIRPREYDGQHINFSGMNPEIVLRRHQINAIAHIMYGGNTLLAHEVGAGKTYEMVGAAMESRRLGLCSKSLIVVPNHITEQWAGEWLQLYPSANILVATKKDFERKNRRKFCSRIATGEYDAIIIGHSQFEKIPMSKERQEAILQRQIDELTFGIQEAKSEKAERYTIKQMEKTRKAIETKLERLNDQSRKDDVVTFEELGIDRVFIDESHYFKNLFLISKMRNVGGIAQTEAQKSSDLFMKCQYLDEITDGRGMVFATGTPISNSMVELYTIQRYLQYRTLQEMGLTHFDEWAANYGETITAIELSPEGTGYRAKTRFAKFYNLPELMSVFKQVADIQTADMLDLPVPKANFHTEVIKPSELQKEMVAGLAERAEAIRAGNVDPSVDNMLRITNDGRKLALDMRLMNPLAADDENNKTSACARNVYRIWEQSKEQRSAQLVFCDLSTPKNDGSFNIYDDLKRKLMEKGIPEGEIAFIHDANTELRKAELFAKVRSGQVRVLMGSTQKMGAGTNVQDRLIALHDLDCPWRPSDLAQRLGRIVRQGNLNPEVEIFRYVTEGTFDSYLYQLVENKQKFIAQIMTSKTPLRAAEDVDETALNYAEIKALASGNPLIIEKCNLDMEVGKLNMLKANHLSQKYALEELVIRKYPEAIKLLTERLAGYEQDIQLVAAHPKLPEQFPSMEIMGTAYAEKEPAGKAIIDACTKMTGSDAVFLGQYRGFSMVLVYDGPSNEYRLTLKGTLSHTAVLGADIYGNLTRIDNVLDGLTTKRDTVMAELDNTRVQLENAKTELAAPFSREAELTEKTARLKELNILLNMDEKDRSLVDAEPDEPAEKPQRNRDYER